MPFLDSGGISLRIEPSLARMLYTIFRKKWHISVKQCRTFDFYSCLNVKNISKYSLDELHSFEFGPLQNKLRQANNVTRSQKQQLEKQLWGIANTLRGNMDANEFRDYILGFVFYKYLSEKQHKHANKLLETESVKEYEDVTDEEYIDAIRTDSLTQV